MLYARYRVGVAAQVKYAAAHHQGAGISQRVRRVPQVQRAGADRGHAGVGVGLAQRDCARRGLVRPGRSAQDRAHCACLQVKRRRAGEHARRARDRATGQLHCVHRVAVGTDVQRATRDHNALRVCNLVRSLQHCRAPRDRQVARYRRSRRVQVQGARAHRRQAAVGVRARQRRRAARGLTDACRARQGGTDGASL